MKEITSVPNDEDTTEDEDASLVAKGKRAGGHVYSGIGQGHGKSKASALPSFEGISEDETMAARFSREESVELPSRKKRSSSLGGTKEDKSVATAASLSLEPTSRVQFEECNEPTQPKPINRFMSTQDIRTTGGPSRLARRSSSMAVLRSRSGSGDRGDNTAAQPSALTSRKPSLAQIDHGSRRGIAGAMAGLLNEQERTNLLNQHGLEEFVPDYVNPLPGEQPVPGPGAGGGTAMAIWLGLALDGVPEAMVIGILANSEQMSMALVAGVFMANFPEAIATGAMMRRAQMSNMKNIGLWVGLCVMTGLIAMIAAMIFPRKKATWVDFVTTSSEGLAAGAMLAMIAGTMLPDAYQKGGPDLVGFWTVFGFVAVLLVRVAFPVAEEGPGEHGGH